MKFERECGLWMEQRACYSFHSSEAHVRTQHTQYIHAQCSLLMCVERSRSRRKWNVELYNVDRTCCGVLFFFSTFAWKRNEIIIMLELNSVDSVQTTYNAQPHIPITRLHRVE